MSIEDKHGIVLHSYPNAASAADGGLSSLVGVEIFQRNRNSPDAEEKKSYIIIIIMIIIMIENATSNANVLVLWFRLVGCERLWNRLTMFRATWSASSDSSWWVLPQISRSRWRRRTNISSTGLEKFAGQTLFNFAVEKLDHRWSVLHVK